MRINREQSPRFFTGHRIAAFGCALLAVAGGTAFVVRTRDDFRTARDGLTLSAQHLSRLDAQQSEAVAARTAEFAALERAGNALHSDTAARNRLDATNRTELGVLTKALQTLSQHQAELAAGTARARLLDDCLVGASQVLNEAAVGDVAHLRSTLPTVQRLCSQAAA